MSYSPSTPPGDPSQLAAWLQQETLRIAQAMSGEQPYIRLRVTHTAPARVTDGDMYEADGTDWNPGSGAGTYIRRAGAWVKLG